MATTFQLISPFLWFDGNAEEAVAFYTAIFPNSRTLHISRYGDHGPGPKNSVMTIAFELGGQRFTALNGGPMFKFTEAVSFLVSCDTQAEIDNYWSRLTAHGGQEIQCGWLKDRFGLCWQIVPTVFFDLINAKDPARSERVMRSMMTMVKMDIAALKAAAEGR